MNSSKIYIRLFVESDSEPETLTHYQSFIDMIEELISVEKYSIRKYFKIQEYYEIFITLNVRGEISFTFEEIIRRLGASWNQINERVRVWDFNEENPNETLKIESIKWAEIEMVN